MISSVRRLAGLAAVLGLAVTASIPAIVRAEEIPIRFGWTTSDSPGDPYAVTAHQFQLALDSVLSGTFRVQYFPNRQLGDEKEMVEGLSFGTLDAAVITNAVVANVDSRFLVNDLPFLYGSAEQAHEVLDGPLGQELLDGLIDKNIVGLRFCEGGFRNMINNVRPVKEPDDVEGVKYRVMQNPVFIGMFRSLGGNAVPMPWGEVFPAVQQGAIDGLEIPVPVIANNKYYEVTKYLSLTNHTYSAIVLLMSKKTFGGLDGAQQDAVRRAAVETCDRQREINAQNTAKLISTLEERGMTVNPITDPAAFRERVKPVYEEMRPRIGGDLLDRFLAAVD